MTSDHKTVYLVLAMELGGWLIVGAGLSTAGSPSSDRASLSPESAILDSAMIIDMIIEVSCPAGDVRQIKACVEIRELTETFDLVINGGVM